MNTEKSYKDALMINPEKSFDVSKKPNFYEYSKKDIKKFCTSGDLEHLKKVPLNKFTEEAKNFLLKIMNEKVLEIKLWKEEDQNQLSEKLEEFNLRIISIESCIEYIKFITL